jgi:integrase/recombinase XerD
MNLEEIKIKYHEQIKVKGYSEKTFDSYWWHAEMFFEFINPKFPFGASSQDVNNYLVKISDKSDSFRNQAINGIKFCFDYVFHRKIKAYLVIRPKKRKTQPIILSDQELQSLFDTCKNIKQKAVLSLMYGSGLRVSEVVNLKIKDVDSKSMVMWIRQAKGKKDRMATLTEQTLILLREYFKKYRPIEWLFNGQNLKNEPKETIKQYSTRSIEQFTKDIAIKAGIKKRVHPHLLRHGYCTGVLDCGGNIYDVATTAGHESLKTSVGYIHSSPKYISRIKSPLVNISI